MLPRLCLLHSIFFFSLLPPAFSSGEAPGPKCLTHCGKVRIPYPFGVGPGCFLDPSFDIICNTSTEPPKPYLAVRDHMEVVEINPRQIRVTMPILLNAACYDESGDNILGTGDGAWFGFSVRRTQFAYSDENWLTAVGCDDLVLGLGEGKKKFGGGCVAYCDDSKGGSGFCPENDVGYPPGNGCCRTTVPKGISMLAAQFTDLGKKWRDRKRYSCSYAFIQEKGNNSSGSSYSYDLSDLNNVTTFLDDSERFKGIERVVVRLDWRIGAQNCNRARKNSTYYACQDNTDCVDYNANNARGYLCRCKKGYQGNPYIDGGCQDINECADITTNPCDLNSYCTNTPGSSTCTCRKGYYADESTNGKRCVPSKMIIVFIGVGSIVGFVILLLICYFSHMALRKRMNKKRREKFFKRNGGLLLRQQTNEGVIQKANLYSAGELAKATDNFKESRVLGHGGQGTVYKGMLSDGKIVAIKKSKQVDESQLKQFINEVVILSHINHNNIIKLWGCCLETEVPLLVYEFVANGTLYDLIHGPYNEFPFPWSMRLKIAADIAGALSYIHTSSSIPIFHRDIKSSNFLLDEKFVVKVADFGISSVVPHDQTHLTTMVKGTFGYFDPEYFQSRQYTDKSDVFSFGVVLAELLTGKKPIFHETSQEMETSLATHFLESMDENNLDFILDPQVSGDSRREEVVAVARLSQRCLNWERKMRPTMKEVCIELESLRITQYPRATTHEDRENVRGTEAKNTMSLDIQYEWERTISGISEASSTSSVDIHPFFIETV